MREFRGAAAVAAILLAVSSARAGDEDQTAEARRRAVLGKAGRMVFTEAKKPVSFCNLDGTELVESDAGPAGFVKWLPDGVRVLADCGGRVTIVDSTNGSCVELSADLPEGDMFLPPVPRLSPDSRHAVWWHKRVGGKYKHSLPIAYTVFDTETGAHTDVGPVETGDSMSPWVSGGPMAWWSPQGELFACVSDAPRADDEKPGERWKLVRWSPRDGKSTTVAEVPWGTRVTEMAFLGERFAYGIAPDQAHGFVPQVMSEKGEHLFELVTHGMIWGIRYEPDGSALRLRIQRPDGSHVTDFFRVAPGADPVQIAEFDAPRRVATANPAVLVEERVKMIEGERPPKLDEERSGLFRVDAKTGEATRIGPGNSAVRVGSVIVFWRVTVPNKVKEGQYWGAPPTIPGTDDLWAWDPADGSVIRLTDRGFQARSWDVRDGEAPPRRK